MRTGPGGIWVAATLGTVTIGLAGSLFMGSFLRETSGDKERWSALTIEGRMGLEEEAHSVPLPGNNPAKPNLPPTGDADGDGVPNSEDPDPTNPNNPNPNPNEFRIGRIEKFVVKDNQLVKSDKVPLYFQRLFVIHVEFTNNNQARTVRVTDFKELDSLAVPDTPEPIICEAGTEVAPFNDTFCIGEPTLKPNRLDITKRPPTWDISVSRPGKYKMIFYVTGRFCIPPEEGGGPCKAETRENVVEAIDLADLGKKNRPEKDTASLTGVNKLDLKLVKQVKNGRGDWADITEKYLGSSAEFRLALDLNNKGGNHDVTLRDHLSGMIFESGTVSYNDSEPQPIDLKDIANWSLHIPWNQLGHQRILFEFRAKVAMPGILTNTATLAESIRNRATQRVFVVTLFDLFTNRSICEFCKIGRVKNLGEGYSQLIYARPDDEVEFKITLEVHSSRPVNLTDILPEEGAIEYIPDTIEILENGKRLQRDDLEDLFKNGIELRPQRAGASSFEINFNGFVRGQLDDEIINTAVSHVLGTDEKEDLLTEMIIKLNNERHF